MRRSAERLRHRFIVPVAAVLTLFTGLLDWAIVNPALSGPARQFGIDAALLATVLGALRIRGGIEGSGTYHAVLLMVPAVTLASIAVCFLTLQAWEGSREVLHGDTTRARRADALWRVVGAGESEDVLCIFSTMSTAAEQELLEHRQIVHAVFLAQREALHRLHDRGSIGEAVLRRIEHDLEIEELQIMTGARVNALCRPSSSQNDSIL